MKTVCNVSKSLKHILSPRFGKRELVCVLLVHLFVCFVRVSFCHFSLPLPRGLAAVCNCGTPRTFLLTFLKDSNQTIGEITEFIFLKYDTINSLNLTFNTRYSAKSVLTSRVFIA